MLFALSLSASQARLFIPPASLRRYEDPNLRGLRYKDPGLRGCEDLGLRGCPVFCEPVFGAFSIYEQPKYVYSK